MRRTTEKNKLSEKILLLKEKQKLELEQLKVQFNITYESLKPINLITNGLKTAIFSTSLKSTLLNNSIGLTTGFLSKKILFGKTNNSFSKIVSNLFEYTIANFVSAHSENIKMAGNYFSNFLKDKLTSNSNKTHFEQK